MPPPRRVVIADDRMNAEAPCEWAPSISSDARQLLQAMARRQQAARTPAEAFHLHRQAQSQRARTLAMLLLPFDADHGIPLRRAPDVRQACLEAYGPGDVPYVASLRELLGLIGAHEWRKNGVEVPALAARIHPHYGVFAPIRSEYVGLVATAPLPAPVPALAFDIGTGTGVLAAVLARRGIARIVATDQDPRALACATENIERLGLAGKVEVVPAHLFPPGRAALVVCNPPWLPARPSSPIEHAIYDPDSRMLRGFLGGLAAHLAPEGVGWLLLSDLAERLGLRSRERIGRRDRRSGVESGRPDGCPARSSARLRHGRSAACRAFGGSDIAVAACGRVRRQRTGRIGTRDARKRKSHRLLRAR